MHSTVMLPSFFVIMLPCAWDVGAEQNHSMMVFEPLNPYAIMHRISFQVGQEHCWLLPHQSLWKRRGSGRTYQSLGTGAQNVVVKPLGNMTPHILSRIKIHPGQEHCPECGSSCPWISWPHRKMVLGLPPKCAASVVLDLCITDHIVSASNSYQHPLINCSPTGWEKNEEKVQYRSPILESYEERVQ